MGGKKVKKPQDLSLLLVLLPVHHESDADRLQSLVRTDVQGVRGCNERVRIFKSAKCSWMKLLVIINILYFFAFSKFSIIGIFYQCVPL